MGPNQPTIEVEVEEDSPVQVLSCPVSPVHHVFDKVQDQILRKYEQFTLTFQEKGRVAVFAHSKKENGWQGTFPVALPLQFFVFPLVDHRAHIEQQSDDLQVERFELRKQHILEVPIGRLGLLIPEMRPPLTQKEGLHQTSDHLLVLFSKVKTDRRCPEQTVGSLRRPSRPKSFCRQQGLQDRVCLLATHFIKRKPHLILNDPPTLS